MAQTINVDSKPALFMPTLYYSQGDVGRTFEIVVSSSDGFTIPSGATCQMVATKPSGLGFTVAGTVSGNKVTFTTTAVMTDEWGRFPAELRITSGNTVIGTANFYMEGERNPHPDGTTDGQQEQLIPELTLLVERAENAAQTATDDAIEAASATIDEVLNYLPTEVTNLKSELTDETNARILLAGRMTTAEGDIDTLETHKVAQPLDEYNQPTDGTDGQLLRTKGDGTTEWVDEGLPTDEQTSQAVSDWLDEHPEATTTVQDGSLTEAKFSDALKLKTIKDYVTPQMYGAKGDGVTNDLASFNSVVASMSDGDVLYIPNGEYLLNDTWTISKNITVYCDGTIRVTHSKPVIILNALSNAKIDINTIEKNARVFDYVESGLTYSIGVILKNCDGCSVKVDNILNTTTGVVLLADNNKGCQYNIVACNNAHVFTGIEIIRANTGGWVNGNIVEGFRWMVNTWFDNTNLIPSYMIKSLSYATSGESEPYKNNANMFNDLVAEYGAQQADYPISLVRLDYARGYTFNFNRVEILAKTSSLYDNTFYFTNSLFCIATVWFDIGNIASNIESDNHNYIYKKDDYENLKNNGIVDLDGEVILHENISFTDNWFTMIKCLSTKTCRLQGELIINSTITDDDAIFTNLPKAKLGYGTMKIQLGTTSTLWQAPTNITYHKVYVSSGSQKMWSTGSIPAGTRLYLDFEYVYE